MKPDDLVGVRGDGAALAQLGVVMPIDRCGQHLRQLPRRGAADRGDCVMAGASKIEWTEATWNPIVGCSIVSPGCTNCYAMTFAGNRLDGNPKTPHYAGTTQKSKAGPVWTGKVALAPERKLLEPLRWKRSRMIFVNSMGDLFHESVPDEWIDKVFAVMALCPQHTFQVLTKRAERMRSYCNAPQTPFRIARIIDTISGTNDLEPEEVRPIAGYDGYFVSSHGHVYSEKRGSRRRLKPDVGDQGHMRVPLYPSGDKCYDRILVHRIVLEAFVGPAPAPDIQGRHRDSDPTNNAVSNLVWGDQEANWADSRRHGTHRRYSKLTEEQASEIRRRHASGESGEALAREFPVSATQIRNIASGTQWAIDAPIEWPMPQIWLGVSAEDQKRADERIPHLLATPAALRFISAEPLLGAIDFTRIPIEDGFSDALRAWHWIEDDLGRNSSVDGPKETIDWIIVGGESGPGARPMHPDWARSIRDQCQDAGVPFFFKQWGEWGNFTAGVPAETSGRFNNAEDRVFLPDGRVLGAGNGKDGLVDPKWRESGGAWMSRVGKHHAGRLLDGREHNAMPEASR